MDDTSMTKIWAPWRSHDLLEVGYKKWDCLFCGLRDSEDDEKNLILERSSHSLCVMNLYPYNNGHIMIAPYRHTALFEDLSLEELSDMNLMTQRWIKLLKKLYSPDGFNIGMNLGTAAGAGVAGHLHCHIVPRWAGDANFMDVIGRTEVVSVSLASSYKKLKEICEAN